MLSFRSQQRIRPQKIHTLLGESALSRSLNSERRYYERSNGGRKEGERAVIVQFDYMDNIEG
jgi:hypothetical protein